GTLAPLLAIPGRSRFAGGWRRPVARASASLRSTKYQPPSRRPQASTRNSRPIPLRGSLVRWLAPLALAERLFVVAQFDVFLRTAQLALRRPEFAPQPEHRAYAFDIQRGIARQSALVRKQQLVRLLRQRRSHVADIGDKQRFGNVAVRAIVDPVHAGAIAAHETDERRLVIGC